MKDVIVPSSDVFVPADVAGVDVFYQRRWGNPSGAPRTYWYLIEDGSRQGGYTSFDVRDLEKAMQDRGIETNPDVQYSAGTSMAHIREAHAKRRDAHYCLIVQALTNAPEFDFWKWLEENGNLPER
jgi:hypothetical protein